jgi:thiol-disulfide isomerase/thioredoxin
MNNIQGLGEDNLDTFMSSENLIVVFTQETCGACVQIMEHLKKLDEKYTIVLVNPVMHPKSTRFMPIPITSFPKMALFNRGYFIKELTQLNIIQNKIDTI